MTVTTDIYDIGDAMVTTDIYDIGDTMVTTDIYDIGDAMVTTGDAMTIKLWLDASVGGWMVLCRWWVGLMAGQPFSKYHIYRRSLTLIISLIDSSVTFAEVGDLGSKVQIVRAQCNVKRGLHKQYHYYM